MNKTEKETKWGVRKKLFHGESSPSDMGALVCNLIMLGVFVWNQVVYGMDMLFLIIPLALLAIYLVAFCIIPEEYYFTDSSLQIRHRIRKRVDIPYNDVFNYEATSRDSFINIAQINKVKVYYTQKGKKHSVTCLPKDVATFVETLKWNCPEFHENHEDKSKLEVFFNEKN